MHAAKEMLMHDFESMEKEIIENGECGDELIREFEDYEKLKHKVAEHNYGDVFERKENASRQMLDKDESKLKL